jgi:hypothetical protein
MLTLPESGGTPLMSCQRMRQSDGRRLSAGWAPRSGGVEATKIAAMICPVRKASSPSRA